MALRLATPAHAFELTLPGLPTTGASSTPFIFSVMVNVNSQELLPVQSINLYIYRVDNPATYHATLTNLPLSTSTKGYSEAETGGSRAAVSAIAGDGWAYRSGYNIGPEPNGYGPGPTSMRYDVVWYIPVEWRAGSCQVDVKLITTNGRIYTQSGSFTLSVPAPLGATSVTQYVNGADVFTQGFTASSGLRLGVSEMTRFGMKEKDFRAFAPLFAAVVKSGREVAGEVAKFREEFRKMHYCFEEEREMASSREKLLRTF